jgi:hypothetical protein
MKHTLESMCILFAPFFFSFTNYPIITEPAELSRYCDKLLAGWPVLEISLFSKASRPALRPTRRSVQWVLRALFRGVKQPARVTDHSSPSNVEVKNGGAISPLPYTSSWYSA